MDILLQLGFLILVLAISISVYRHLLEEELYRKRLIESIIDKTLLEARMDLEIRNTKLQILKKQIAALKKHKNK